MKHETIRQGEPFPFEQSETQSDKLSPRARIAVILSLVALSWAVVILIVQAFL